MPASEIDCPPSESDSIHSLRDNKVQGPQMWTSSSRCSSVFGDVQLGQASAHTIWNETQKQISSKFEDNVVKPSQKDISTKSEGFGSCPPAVPITVLMRNVKVHGVGSRAEVWVLQEASGAAGERDARRFVQRLLRELIASLPLLPFDNKHVTEPKTDRPVKKNRQASSIRSLSSPPPRRSLSVQTHKSNDLQLESPNTGVAKHRSKGGDEPGWAGGVRALRDAHVRLVLRQLRHVERLNRALDRRARGPAPLDTQ